LSSVFLKIFFEGRRGRRLSLYFLNNAVSLNIAIVFLLSNPQFLMALFSSFLANFSIFASPFFLVLPEGLKPFQVTILAPFLFQFPFL